MTPKALAIKCNQFGSRWNKSDKNGGKRVSKTLNKTEQKGDRKMTKKRATQSKNRKKGDEIMITKVA